ncbi:hypothetical protein LEN26_002283 [Aphanomyces euteiches]|nr:hypothetical protein LEN26_002283 [Aphanomyces euteiches]
MKSVVANFDIGDVVEDVSAPKKSVAKGSKSPPSAKGTPKKEDKKVTSKAATNGAKRGTAIATPPARSKRARIPTNFYLVQSSAEVEQSRQRKEAIDLASDGDDDDNEEEDDNDDEDEEQEKDDEDDEEDDDDDEIEVVEAPASKRQRTSARGKPARVVQQAKPVKKVEPKKKAAPAKKPAPPAPKAKAVAKSSPPPFAKKEAEAKLSAAKKDPAPPAHSSSSNGVASRPVAGGPSDAALNLNTKQSKILAAQIKNLTTAINNGVALVSTVWEQYQEIMQRDIELREATLKVAQAKHEEETAEATTEPEHKETSHSAVIEAAAAADTVAAADEEEKEEDDKPSDPVLL